MTSFDHAQLYYNINTRLNLYIIIYRAMYSATHDILLLLFTNITVTLPEIMYMVLFVRKNTILYTKFYDTRHCVTV